MIKLRLAITPGIDRVAASWWVDLLVGFDSYLRLLHNSSARLHILNNLCYIKDQDYCLSTPKP